MHKQYQNVNKYDKVCTILHTAVKVCTWLQKFVHCLSVLQNIRAHFINIFLKSVLVKNLAQFRTGVHECAHESAQEGSNSKKNSFVCTLCTLVHSYALLYKIFLFVTEKVLELLRALCALCAYPLFGTVHTDVLHSLKNIVVILHLKCT